MANFNFNKVILGGRLTTEPELKYTNNEIAFCVFGIAVSRRKSGNGEQPVADFFNCTAWRKTAEFVKIYFNKGSSICVIGCIQNRSWTDNDGVKRYATDIIVEEVSFVDSKSDVSASDGTPF